VRVYVQVITLVRNVGVHVQIDKYEKACSPVNASEIIEHELVLVVVIARYYFESGMFVLGPGAH
jgi:hypothetical protein